MSPDTLSDLQARTFANYARFGLAPWLTQMRASGRYEGLDGHNVLTNAELTPAYDRAAAIDELARARAFAQVPFRSQLEAGRQGLSFGLNPYTDWSLAQLDGPPERWALVMGLDWYSISKLLPDGLAPERWYDYVADPFIVPDPYWTNLWTWILGKYHRDAPPPGEERWLGMATRDEAAAFIRRHRVGVIFHNWIPYLRPADVSSTADNWPDAEWGKKGVRDDILADLAMLWRFTEGRIDAFATNVDICKALRTAGFAEKQVASLGAHPSYHNYFHAAHFRKKRLWFPAA